MDTTKLVERTKKKLDSLMPTIDALHQLGISKEIAMGHKSTQIVVTYPPTQSLKAVTSFTPTFAQKRSTLYVHIPFCSGICTYCNYVRTATSEQDKKIRDYIDYLDAESTLLRSAYGKKIPVESIYIGGGTPTLLSIDVLSHLFTILNRDFELTKHAEYTLEGSPETITKDKILLAKSFGVNRVSFGVESFDDHLLRKINRRHNATDVFVTLNTIRNAGITNIDIDLIRGLPGCNNETILNDLTCLKRIRVPSVTSYQYSLKPRSLDSVKKPSLDYDQQEQLFHHLLFTEGMKDLGYNQHPIDWFIKDNSHIYQHQILKWEEMINQLVLGQSAYGYTDGTQFANHSNINDYKNDILQGKLPVAKATTLDIEEILRRRFIFGLKLGIDRKQFKQDQGADPLDSCLAPLITKLSKAGAITITNSYIHLSEVGSLFADWIQMAFYSDNIKK